MLGCRHGPCHSFQLWLWGCQLRCFQVAAVLSAELLRQNSYVWMILSAKIVPVSKKQALFRQHMHTIGVGVQLTSCKAGSKCLGSVEAFQHNSIQPVYALYACIPKPSSAHLAKQLAHGHLQSSVDQLQIERMVSVTTKYVHNSHSETQTRQHKAFDVAQFPT